MSVNHIAKVTKEINAPAARVWDALTNPELIREYFFGANAISEWKQGSEIRFEGTWQDKPYTDKGTIQLILPEKILQFTYYSPLSGLDDVPENYQSISYELEENNGVTTLTVKNANLSSEEQKEQSQKNWEHVLENLERLLERTSRISPAE